MTHEYFALAAQLAFDHARRRTDQGVAIMPSKYDHPDPGQDPAYCDGLVAGDEDSPYMQWAPIPKHPWGVHRPNGRVIKRFTTAARARAYLECLTDESTAAERDDRPPRTLTRQERLEGLGNWGVDTWEEWRGER